jgi:16S rRNA (cytosine967-C5)-methyltransferase
LSLYQAHIHTAQQLLAQYKGLQPLAAYLKYFFSKNKKYGSKDRRSIAALCYNFYRLLPDQLLEKNEDNLLIASYLCEPQPQPIIQKLRPHWLPANLPQAQLLAQNQQNTFIEKQLSSQVPYPAYAAALRQQPSLFLRMRPSCERSTMDKLDEADMPYKRLQTSTLKLPNGSKIDQVLELDRAVQVQDYSSQRVGYKLAQSILDTGLSNPSLWDCCAASGGKSLLLFDTLPPFKLWVSDNRPSILQNLKTRFATAGLSQYSSFLADLTQPNHQLPNQSIDILLADVPCTGSGTWARTPEAAYFCSHSQVQTFAQLQASIIAGTLPKLKPGGLLFYITCSVFSAENEENCQKITQTQPLSLIESNYILGIEHNADSMFYAIFRKNQ